MALIDEFFQLACEVWHIFFEIGDSRLPIVERGWNIGEQILEGGNQACRFGDVQI